MVFLEIISWIPNGILQTNLKKPRAESMSTQHSWLIIAVIGLMLHDITLTVQRNLRNKSQSRMVSKNAGDISLNTEMTLNSLKGPGF